MTCLEIQSIKEERTKDTVNWILNIPDFEELQKSWMAGKVWIEI